MPMRVPAARAHVHFHVPAARKLLARLDDRTAKIRASLMIPKSGVQDLDWPSVQGHQFIAQDALMKPNELEQPFRWGRIVLAQKRRQAAALAPLGVKIRR